MRLHITAVLMLWLSLPVAGQTSPFKFVPVNIPGAEETQVRGVNNYGEIVGFYKTPNAPCYSPTASMQVPNCNVHGFKIINGKVTTVNVPGSVSTAIMGVNDYGDIVGLYLTAPDETCSMGVYHGFVWLHTGTIKTLDTGMSGFCGTDALWTTPMGINRSGAVVGMLWSFLDGQPSGGFVWQNGTFHGMHLGQPGLCVTCTGVYGVANGGPIVGTGWRVSGQIPMWTAYLKKGPYQWFFVKSQDDTWATAVNNGTDVIGYGIPGSGFFVKNLAVSSASGSDFESRFIPLMYPGGAATWPWGLNDKRTAVGAYRDDSGAVHGFVATPNF